MALRASLLPGTAGALPLSVWDPAVPSPIVFLGTEQGLTLLSHSQPGQVLPTLPGLHSSSAERKVQST